MTAEEAAQLLALCQGTWPFLATDPVSNRLWQDDLEGLTHAIAYAAFRRLRDGFDDRMGRAAPSWATFLEAYRAEAMTAQIEDSGQRALAPPAEPSVPRERVADLVAEARESLTRGVEASTVPERPRSTIRGTFDARTPMYGYDDLYESPRLGDSTVREQRREDVDAMARSLPARFRA